MPLSRRVEDGRDVQLETGMGKTVAVELKPNHIQLEAVPQIRYVGHNDHSLPQLVKVPLHHLGVVEVLERHSPPLVSRSDSNHRLTHERISASGGQYIAN